ncbi:MAG: HET domain-containing protein [Candidatus Moeniiplasma glomeromycotorum]|nr:HET domain-containing protein [Candidatus Moeniiplasma glomeromycotorum]MCE8169324.1 HET domain-containing protein [Candidatus Moeniiplasma glomeromycotorum]
MTNWKNIHPDFTEELQKEWEDRGFSYEECKEWVNTLVLLPPSEWVLDLGVDLDFCVWSRDVKKISAKQINGGNVNKLWKEYKLVNAQEWLEKYYSYEERRKKEVLVVSGKKLRGKLDLSDFVNLELLDCHDNYLTSLEISSCPSLRYLHCYNNELNFLSLNNNQKLEALKCGNNLITKLDLTNNPQLTSVSCVDNQLTELDLSKNIKLVYFCCNNNFLTKLDISECLSLEDLICNDNQLMELKIGSLTGLKKIICVNNQLVNLKASSLTKSRLEMLEITNNHFSPQDLSFLSDFINLRGLGLGTIKKVENWEEKKNYKDYNQFYGSLEHLKRLTKLEKLAIPNTDIDEGLMYLSGKIDTIWISTDVRQNARCQHLKNELEKYKETSDYLNLIKNDEKEADIKMVPNVPPQLRTFLNIRKFNTEEDYNCFTRQQRLLYNKIYPENSLSLKINKVNPLPREKLPTRLFYIDPSKSEEELIKEFQIDIVNKKEVGNHCIKNYAILSYVWGEKKPSEKLSQGGQLSLLKAIKVCRLLGINYLWIDQLCIIQEGETAKGDKENEIPNMRKYYSNAEVTLVAIHKIVNEIKGEKSVDFVNVTQSIINSQWFSRSWTYQEGWLSKQTVFMFDNILIDGRAVAVSWVVNQPLLGLDNVTFSNIKDHSIKIATPLGWTYYKGEYRDEDKISLTLSQVLRTVKNRKRTLSIDGIYSVLGLLPYGNKIVPKYKKWGDVYTKTDLEEALFNVMKAAIENGYAEPFAWHGEGINWLPNISSSGCCNDILGEIKINLVMQSADFGIDDNSIEVIGSEYLISACDESEIHNELSQWYWDKNVKGIRNILLLENGLYRKNVEVKFDSWSNLVTLWGTREVLEQVEIGKILVMLDRERYKSERPFALLVEKNGEIYQRIGLIEFFKEEEAEKLQEVKKKRMMFSFSVGNNSKTEKKPQKKFIDLGQEKEENKTITPTINDWQNINLSFTPQLTQSWQNLNFSYQQTQEWINTGLQSTDYNFCAWLRDEVKITPIEFLNDGSRIEELKEQFSEYQNYQQAQIEIPPKK